MRRRHRSYNYKFTEKTHSRKGILGLALAVISIVAGIVLIVISFQSKGNGTIYLGSGGVLSMLIGFTAFGLAIAAIGEENSYRIFPVAATIVSVISLLGWIAIYIVGFLRL